MPLHVNYCYSYGLHACPLIHNLLEHGSSMKNIPAMTFTGLTLRAASKSQRYGVVVSNMSGTKISENPH